MKFGSCICVVLDFFFGLLRIFTVLVILFPILSCASFKGCTLAIVCPGRLLVRQALRLAEVSPVETEEPQLISITL